jgi:hypothetical protein
MAIERIPHQDIPEISRPELPGLVRALGTGYELVGLTTRQTETVFFLSNSPRAFASGRAPGVTDALRYLDNDFLRKASGADYPRSETPQQPSEPPHTELTPLDDFMSVGGLVRASSPIGGHVYVTLDHFDRNHPPKDVLEKSRRSGRFGWTDNCGNRHITTYYPDADGGKGGFSTEIVEIARGSSRAQATMPELRQRGQGKSFWEAVDAALAAIPILR